MSRTGSPQLDVHHLALALGWSSVALGIAELAAPGRVADLLGWRNETPLNQTDRRRLGLAAVVAGAATLGVMDRRLTGRHRRIGRARTPGVRVEQVVTINRTIDDVFAFWRDFANFPRFMRHVEQIDVIDSRRSRWRVKAPAGMTVEWDAEILAARPNEWISWRSLPGSNVMNSGSVRFAPAPGARGTEVRVQLEYVPPAGSVGRGIAWLFGEEPEQQVREDLRRFKQLMETGTIPISDAPGLWRAARPPKRVEELRQYAGVAR